MIDAVKDFVGGLFLALLIVVVVGVPFLYVLRSWLKREYRHEQERNRRDW